MVEPLKWDKIDITTHILPNMTSFHVDMLGFHYMYTTDKLERYEDVENNTYLKNWNKLYDLIHSNEDIDEKFLMEERRVIPFIFSVREMRDLYKVIATKNDSDHNNFWLKYIRFYPYKGKYIVTNDGKLLDWSKVTSQKFFGN